MITINDISVTNTIFISIKQTILLANGNKDFRETYLYRLQKENIVYFLNWKQNLIKIHLSSP